MIGKKKYENVDVYDPYFPWKDGKPDWATYRQMKEDEREEAEHMKWAAKGKRPPLFKDRSKERCCYFENEMNCGKPAYTLTPIPLPNNKTDAAPLCEKHKKVIIERIKTEFPQFAL